MATATHPEFLVSDHCLTWLFIENMDPLVIPRCSSGQQSKLGIPNFMPKPRHHLIHPWHLSTYRLLTVSYLLVGYHRGR